MAALLFKGVVKTRPVLLLTRCGTSISSVNGQVYSRIQQRKALCSQTRAQQEENSYNVHHTVQVAKENQLLLREIFNCSQDAVELILTKHPRLKSMSIPLLEQKINLLLSYNLPLTLITKNPWILYQISYEELSRRLELLQARSLLTDNPVRSQDKVFNNLGQSIEQFDTGYKNMCDELDALEGCANKSERMAQIFQCSQDDLESILTKHPRLKSMAIPLLEQKINLLLSYNLPLTLIAKNPRLLYLISYEELSRRLELLQARSLLTDNPVSSHEKVFHYLRQNIKQFDVACKKMCDELDALEGCASKSERIAQIFQCSQDDLESILTKHPRLKSMSIPLLEQKINLLLFYNLPLALIIENPKLLLYSHEELSRRLELLKARSLLTDNQVLSHDKVFHYLRQRIKQFDVAYKKMCDEPNALKECASKLERIAQIFQCSQDEVKSILAQHPSLENVSLSLLELKVNLLLSYNLPLSLIIKNPVPLYHTSHHELSRRLQLFKAKSLLIESNFNYLGCSIKRFDAAYEKMCAEIGALEGRASKCALL